MKKKKVLVTGASGFIGRNIFEFLSERKDLEVFGTYHTDKLFGRNSHIIKADFTRKDDTLKVTKGMDLLIQCAATTSGAKDTITRPYYHVTDNVIMNSLLFQSAYENNVSHVIFFSCTTMYPMINRPVKESDLNLNDEMFDKYFGVGWAKVYLEKLCEFYSRLGKTKYTVIRHSNIYGPYDKYDLEKSHVFGATVTKVMTAENSAITVWGDGKEERDLLYISDLVNFVEVAIAQQKSRFDIFNVGLGESVSISDLVSKIIKISGKKIKIVYDKTKPTISTKLVLDISKVKKQFGWYPKVDIDRGIKMTLEWYKQNIKTS